MISVSVSHGQVRESALPIAGGVVTYSPEIGVGVIARRTMKMRCWLLIGWLWPFVVAGIGVAIIGTGISSLRRDAETHLLILLAFLGSPAIGISISRCLPNSWPVRLRDVTALLLMLPVFMLELLLASWLFVWGANAMGYGWIE